MEKLDPKVVALERQVTILENMVRQLQQRVDYLDRERTRAKNDINSLVNEIRLRKRN